MKLSGKMFFLNKISNLIHELRKQYLKNTDKEHI